MKVCGKCGEEKPVSEFNKDCCAKDGMQGRCRECQKAISKQYRQEHKEERASYDKQRSQTPVGRFVIYKSAAKKRGLEFDLTVEQFEEITSQVCYYCGEYAEGKEYCGIDRIDNGVAYVLDNCVPCCAMCNAWKSDLTLEEFLNHAKNIVHKRGL